MRAGAVILNYNSYDLTEKLAKKLAGYDAIEKIVVVDNVSTDDSYSHLKALNDSKIEVKQSGRNGGYSYGNNFGVKILDKYNCDIVFILNPDVDVDKQSINKILKEFERNNEYAILTGVEYDIEDNISNPPIWKRNEYKDDLRECFFLGRKMMKKEEKIDYSRSVQPVEIVKGSFFAIRTDDFNRVGGFDERVFLFCEERIISRKVSDENRLIGVVTSAKYNHNHSTSINKEYKSVTKQIKLLYKSRYYYNNRYNNIGFLKRLILLIGMKISLVEYWFIDLVKKLRNELKTKC